MSLISTLIGSPYALIAVAAIGAGGGAYVTHKLDSASYEGLEAKYSAYVTQATQAELAAQQASTAALTAQLKQQHDTDANNAQVIASLQAKAASAVSAADLAHRLLSAAQSAKPASSGAVFAAPNQPTASSTSPAGGFERIATACAAVAIEDRQNADALDALNAELTPQVN